MATAISDSDFAINMSAAFNVTATIGITASFDLYESANLLVFDFDRIAVSTPDGNHLEVRWSGFDVNAILAGAIPTINLTSVKLYDAESASFFDSTDPVLWAATGFSTSLNLLSGLFQVSIPSLDFTNFQGLSISVNIASVVPVVLGGNDAITGSALSDRLLGYGGNDTLTGGGGSDTLIGLGGNDTYFVDSTGDVVGEASGQGTDTVRSTITYNLGALGPAGVGSLENLLLEGAGEINGIGNELSNRLVGNSASNRLIGALGADTLAGNSGMLLTVGAFGDGTPDTLIGGGGSDTYLVENGDVIHEGAGGGTDVVISLGDFTLGGGLDNLTLGGNDNSTGVGNEIANIIRGNTGSNSLDGATGADTMDGGFGDDEYFVDNANDRVTELVGGGLDAITSTVSFVLGAGIENLHLIGSAHANGTGNGLNNIIGGNDGNNILAGGAGNDTLTGGAGNDRLDGGTGSDSMAGGTGNDTYVVDTVADIVDEAPGEGIDTVQSSVSFNAGANSIERVLLTGPGAIHATGNGDANELTGNAAANSLEGGAGNDSLDGGLGSDTLTGGEDDDLYFVNAAGDRVREEGTTTGDEVRSLVAINLSSNAGVVSVGSELIDHVTLLGTGALSAIGNGLANRLTGNAGANMLDGGTDNDTLAGGAGNDTLVVDSVDDIVVEAANGGTADLVRSSVDFDLAVMALNVEHLELLTGASTGTGSGGNNRLTGNAGNNTLDGGLGVDTMIGLGGDDTYYVNVAGDAVLETIAGAAGGVDTVLSAVNYALGANIENLMLHSQAANGTGNGLNNSITGSLGNNLLTGGAGNDTLDGGDGNDTLEGGTGNDSLIGADGNDFFLVDSASDRVNDGGGPGDIDEVRSSVSIDLGAPGGVVETIGNIEQVTLLGAAALSATGNSLDNLLVGNGGANTLTGGAGADTLNGGAGGDSLSGGDGNDLYVVDAAGDRVHEVDGDDIDEVRSAVTINLTVAGVVDGDSLNNIENVSLTGAAAASATGNALDNVITGNAAANVLNGADGNDTLNGGAGADNMIGGAGDDIYVVDNAADITTEAAAEGDADTVLSSVTRILGANLEYLTLTGSANVNATGNGLGNVLTGNAGHNVLDGKAGADTMVGGMGNDTFFVDDSADMIVEVEPPVVIAVFPAPPTPLTDLVMSSASAYVLPDWVENIVLLAGAGDATGNALDNRLTGNALDNTLIGGAGDDTLAGGAGNDLLDGGAGNDHADYSAFTTIVNVDLSTGDVEGPGVENETLASIESVRTGSNGDILTGNSGDNTLDGGGGADAMAGGAGNDTYIVDNAGDITSEPGAADGVDTVRSSVTRTLEDILQYIENLVLTGAGAIGGHGNSLDNEITGNAAANVLTGAAGNDTLDGGAGADNMAGGAGNDTYFVDNAADVTNEGTVLQDHGGTELVYSSVTRTLGANLENLTLAGTAVINATGNALDNQLTGNNRQNVLNGGAGSDTMAGGADNDTYVVDSSGDQVVEEDEAGIDLVQSSAAAYTLSEFVENLILLGTAAIHGTGNGGDNAITGNSAANSLDGGAGADTLTGGAGNDTLAGGADNDLYIVDSAFDQAIEEASGGYDTVRSSASFTLGAEVEALLLTGAGNFSGTGNGSDNAITGNAGANVLDGGTGNDTLSGGAGNDTYLVDTQDDIVIDSGGTADTVIAAVSYSIAAIAAIEHLQAKAGSDPVDLTGNAANNRLTGNAGNNVLNGGAGVDTMAGGGGDDKYYVNVAGDVIQETLAWDTGGYDFVYSQISYTLGVNLEYLILQGTANINATGNERSNALEGNAGNNVLDGGLGGDLLLGEGGNDIYIVDSIADSIHENGGSGDYDEVRSSVSIDMLDPDDVVWEGEGIEKVTLTGSGAISARGNDLDNLLIGNGAANVLDGAGGNDTLIGGAGNDTLTGGAGDDVFTFDPADGALSGAVVGGEGNDTLALTSGQTLNLDAVPDTRYSEIEVIDLSGTGNNVLQLKPADVFALNTPHLLIVNGNVGDTLRSIAQGWDSTGTGSIGGNLYATFIADNGAQLWVDADIGFTVT